MHTDWFRARRKTKPQKLIRAPRDQKVELIVQRSERPGESFISAFVGISFNDIFEAMAGRRPECGRDFQKPMAKAFGLYRFVSNSAGGAKESSCYATLLEFCRSALDTRDTLLRTNGQGRTSWFSRKAFVLVSSIGGGWALPPTPNHGDQPWLVKKMRSLLG